MHTFSFKISHMVATILLIFLRINFKYKQFDIYGYPLRCRSTSTREKWDLQFQLVPWLIYTTAFFAMAADPSAYTIQTVGFLRTVLLTGIMHQTTSPIWLHWHQLRRPFEDWRKIWDLIGCRSGGGIQACDGTASMQCRNDPNRYSDLGTWHGYSRFRDITWTA